MNHLVQLIPFLGILVIFGLFYLVTQTLIIQNKRKKRKTPFVGNFLRSPGESLRKQLEENNLDLDVNLISTFFLPLFLYSAILSQAYFTAQSPSFFVIAILVLTTGIFEAYFIFKLVQIFNRRRKFRLGYEGELAVGQELNQLLRDGHYVYHDFPADKFNIDHIIVGPAGVYAVETKARQKPATGNGQADARVVYDGKKIQFPDWWETKPLKQAQIQAKWLSRWLGSAVGAPIEVRPVVALPGWFVDRSNSNGLPVINPKNIRSILKSSKNAPLDKRTIARVVHQIDNRCRDVRPGASEGLAGQPGLPNTSGA